MATPMGDQTSTIRLTQVGTTLSGTMTGPDGDAIAFDGGTVTGNRLAWTAALTKPMALTIAFDVVLAADALTGTFKLGPFPAGPVTGVRA